MSLLSYIPEYHFTNPAINFSDLICLCNILLLNLQGTVRKQIEDGMVPPFYIDKVQLDPQTRVPVSLALSILSK
jgi:hypothetical protein